MKQVIFSFNPFEVRIGGQLYENISDSSVERLDKTLVRLCETNQMNVFFLNCNVKRVLFFEPVKKY